MFEGTGTSFQFGVDGLVSGLFGSDVRGKCPMR